MPNPVNLNWTQPLENVDGSVFDQSQFGGYELELNSQPAVALPAAWNPSGNYTFPLALLELPAGSYELRLRTVNRNGDASAWSNPASFTWTAVPRSPFDVSVA